MLDTLQTLFATPGIGYMPHGMCLSWHPATLWLNVISDAIIALAYLSIPFALLTFLRRRDDVAYRGVFMLFAAFIFWCAVTHVMGVWVVWNPDFLAQGLVKLVTATISIMTAMVLWPLIPHAAALPSPSALQSVNRELAEAKSDLERRVQERTAELEQARSIMVSLMDAQPVSVAWFDDAHRLRIWNRRYQAFHGAPLAEGMHYDDIVRARVAIEGLSGDAAEAEVARRCAAHRAGDSLEIHSLGRDMLASRTRTVDGGTVLAMVDISEIRQAERELAAHAAALERSNAELDAFAYTASHDLKEPLRGINNYAAFLLEDYGARFDDAGRARLETLVKLSHRLEAFIDDLLRFSRVSREDLAIEATDLDTVVDEALDSLAYAIEERGVEVEVKRPLPTVHCDATGVREVFQNLVSNACKYNDGARPRIEIGAESGPDGPTLYVRDNGIGIPEKHLETIFGIFKRLHGRERYGGGTGAGLTIARKIVERHGGRIWVESTPGEGTVVRFTLRAQAGSP